MKVQEVALSGIKELLRNSTEGVKTIQWLVSNGFTMSGMGGFGVTYAKGRLVAKLYDQRDQCFSEFVNFCRAHDRNPHFPRFSKIRGMDGFNLVFTEKLYPITHSEFDPFVDWYHRDLPDIPSEWHGLIKAFGIIRKNKSAECTWDIHKGNVMKRNEFADSPEEWVIIDPLFTASALKAVNYGKSVKWLLQDVDRANRNG